MKMSNQDEIVRNSMQQLIASVDSTMDFVKYIDDEIENVRKLVEDDEKPLEQKHTIVDSNTKNIEKETDSDYSECAANSTHTLHQIQTPIEKQDPNSLKLESSTASYMRKHRTSLATDLPTLAYFFDGILLEDPRRTNRFKSRTDDDGDTEHNFA